MNPAPAPFILRFSLQSLVLVAVWTGACATLLIDLQHPLRFSCGIVSTIYLVGVLLSAVVRANIPEHRVDAD